MQREEMSAVTKLSLSEGVGVHDTGRAEGAIAARSSSSGNSISPEPQVSSTAPEAVDFYQFSSSPLGESLCWITKQSPVKLEHHSYYIA